MFPISHLLPSKLFRPLRIVLFIFSLIILLSESVSLADTYPIVDIGGPIAPGVDEYRASGLSQDGKVVGYGPSPWYWSKVSGYKTLPVPAQNFSGPILLGVNSAGIAVGYVNVPNNGYQAGLYYDLNSPNQTPVVVPPVTGGAAQFLAVNEVSTFAGSSTQAFPKPQFPCFFSLTDSWQCLTIDSGWATGINDFGAMTGYYNGGNYVFYYSLSTGARLIGTRLGGRNYSRGGPNNSGIMVIQKQDTSVNPTLYSSYLYHSDSDSFEYIPEFQLAYQINNLGHLIGETFPAQKQYLRANGVLTDIQDLIDPVDDWQQIDILSAINDSGQIIGRGKHNFLIRPFFLDLSPPLPPTEPIGLAATAGTQTNVVQVTWTDTQRELWYDVFRSLDSSQPGTMVAEKVRALSYSEKPPLRGERYFYNVRARGAFGQVFSSVPAEGWTPADLLTPTGLTATEGTISDRVRLSWGSVPGASSYVIYRSATQQGPFGQVGITSSLAFEDLGALPKPNVFYFKVRAVNAGGVSDYTITVQGWISSQSCASGDPDTDGDGIPNCSDQCPNDPAKAILGACGCGISDVDSDGDGVPNCSDQCPQNSTKSVPGACGCGVSDTDTDGEGVPDCIDSCPLDSQKSIPGVCGCGISEIDTDGDGSPNCIDQCIGDSNKVKSGICGCGVVDKDTDGDGMLDCFDSCPFDPSKSAPGKCGCGVSEVDADGDGAPNCIDQCPLDDKKNSAGLCGCGKSDVDTDQDGLPDCLDACPKDALKSSVGVCGCGVSDNDLNGNKIPDCLDPGSSLNLTAPKVTIKKGVVTVTMQSFTGVSYVVDLKGPKNFKSRKTSSRPTVTFKGLKKGKYSVFYNVKVGVGIFQVRTRQSAGRSFTVKP